MPGKAYEAARRFWDVQDDGNYNQLVDLFTEDAVAEDDAVGRFEGKEAIAGFMAQMSKEMPARGVHFEVQEIAGDDETAWARWQAVFSDGQRFDGVGIYKVRDGKLSYYRDYHAINRE